MTQKNINITQSLEPKEIDLVMRMMAKLNDMGPDLLRGEKELDKMPLTNVVRGIRYYLKSDEFNAGEKRMGNGILKKIYTKLSEGKSILEKIDIHLELK